jgi:hypothetical protein
MRRGPGTELLSKFLGNIPDPMSMLMDQFAPDSIRDIAPDLSALLKGDRSAASISHKAIAIRWKGPTSRDQWLKARATSLNGISLSVGMPSAELILNRVTDTTILRQVISAVPREWTEAVLASLNGGQINTPFRDRLIELIGHIPEGSLQSGTLNHSWISLDGTPAASRLEAIFRPFVIGNEGEVRLQSLELDLSTGRLEGTVSGRHRHVWKFSDLMELGDKGVAIVKEMTQLKLG